MTTVNSFLSDWLSHPEYWFDPKHTYDEYITNHYKELLEEPWNKNSPDVLYHLGKLVVYDQVSRHVHREEQEKISTFLSSALEVFSYIKKHFDIEKFTALEWSFYCLPIRHSKNSREIMKIIQDTWQRLSKESDPREKEQYIKFLKASYERCPKEQNLYIEEHTFFPPYPFTDFFQYADILAYCPVTSSSPKNQLLLSRMEEFIVQHKIKRIMLSISGGVDSMVCSYLLKQLQTKWKFEWCCTFINYNNRGIQEYNFVRDWCQYLQIPLYTRHITEIHRKPCMENGLRNTYEDYTKQVRFHSYKDVWNYRCSYPDFPKVILGHNADDCFENIMTNICHKAKYENLYGMNEEQIIDEILFYRPLLSISKQQIYDYAHEAGIPYLVDSTPSWSQRGKIRDKVRPCLEAWNPEMVPAMFELADRIREYEAITHHMVEVMVKGTIIHHRTEEEYVQELVLPISEILYSKTIWKKYFGLLGIMVKHKSLLHFVEKLEEHIGKKKVDKSGYFQTTLNKQTSMKYRKTSDGNVKVKICSVPIEK